MKKANLKSCFTMFCLTCLMALHLGTGYAWNEDVTHFDLSGIAAQNSVLAKGRGNYLSNLGLSKALAEPFLWGRRLLSVSSWIKEGAKREDEGGLLGLLTGSGRSYNHFHNPLKPWLEAGLNDWPTSPYVGMSSLLWAQGPTEQNTHFGGDWSWQTVRSFYYLALTSKTDPERQENFAKMFRGLGHQMHLVQDTSMPDHIRNDAHPSDSLGSTPYFIGMEKWATGDILSVMSFAVQPIFPTVSFDVYREGLSPSTQLWDTDQYKADDPSSFFATNQATSLGVGLAEYTNANFFSEDTIFSSERYPVNHRHYFPYPKKSSTDLQTYEEEGKLPERIVAEDGVEDVSFWIKKQRDGAIVEHFVKPTYFTLDVLHELGPEVTYYRTFYRDRLCHEDYARRLIPRAVGYSGALLDYFFRGQLDVKQREVESDGTVVKIDITNLSRETIGKGKFELYYDNDQEKRIFLGEWPVNELPPEETFAATFARPTDFGPGKKNQYMLVYKGRLGEEEDSVIGKYFSLGDYRGCMVVYHKYLRKIFFMTHDEKGNEVSFYIDLKDIIRISANEGYEDDFWKYDYGPLNIAVLEYNARVGALAYKYMPTVNSIRVYVLKFRVKNPSPTGETFTYNIGCEVANEGWQALGTSPSKDPSWYGEKTSYPLDPNNCPYGVGEKAFVKYDFDFILEPLRAKQEGNEGRTVGKAAFNIWEEDYGSSDLATLRWDLTYTTSWNNFSMTMPENDELWKIDWSQATAWHGWMDEILQMTVNWYNVDNPKTKPFVYYANRPWDVSRRLGGIATGLNNNHKGVARRWWEWEVDGRGVGGGTAWHYGVASPFDVTVQLDRPGPGADRNYGTLFKGLPNGGLEKRMMGVFHGSNSFNLIYHYMIDGAYYWGDGALSIEQFPPDVYPFGPAGKELLVAFEKLNGCELVSVDPYVVGNRSILKYVPVMQIEAWNSAIPVTGDSLYPRAWHAYKVRGLLKLDNGTIDTVYGIFAGRQSQWDNSLPMANYGGLVSNNLFGPDGAMGDYRYISDYGLIRVPLEEISQ